MKFPNPIIYKSIFRSQRLNMPKVFPKEKKRKKEKEKEKEARAI